MVGKGEVPSTKRLFFGSVSIYYCTDVGSDVEGRFGEEDEGEAELLTG